MYALAERYASGGSASVLAQAAEVSNVQLLGLFKKNLPPVMYERVIRCRLKASWERPLWVEEKVKGLKKWTFDDPAVQSMARLYLGGEKTLREICQEFGIKSLPNLRYALQSAFGKKLFRGMMKERKARVEALGRKSSKAGNPAAPKWKASSPIAREMLALYEEGKLSVSDIAARFGLATDTAAVSRIIKSAFGKSRFGKAQKKRSLCLALRGVDPEELAQAYIEAKESKRELAHRLLGVSQAGTLDRALRLAVGEKRFARLQAQRRQISKPGPKPGFDASHRSKWTSDSSYVRRVTAEYLSGEKTIRQIAADNGLGTNTAVHYWLRKAYGDEKYAKMKAERRRAKQKPRSGEQSDT
ncbi:MAG: hypothetical protein Q8P99_00725 [bacterium]|nr:hypothetical protein [bacterium]